MNMLRKELFNQTACSFNQFTVRGPQIMHPRWNRLLGILLLDRREGDVGFIGIVISTEGYNQALEADHTEAVAGR
jgi:hypothetical protein